MKTETASKQFEDYSETSVEDARWLLGGVVFIAFVVFTAGVIASIVAA